MGTFSYCSFCIPEYPSDTLSEALAVSFRWSRTIHFPSFSPQQDLPFLTLKSPSSSACQCSQNTVGRYSVNPKRTLLPCQQHPSSFPLQYQSSPVSACTWYQEELGEGDLHDSYLKLSAWSPRSDSWSYQTHLPGAVLSLRLRQSQRLTRDSNQPSGVCQLECLVRLHGMQGEMCFVSASSIRSSLPVGQAEY